MNGNRWVKRLLKQYPQAKNHFRLINQIQTSLSNKAFKKEKIKSFVVFLASAFENFEKDRNPQAFLENLLENHFKKNPPEDAILHLCRDAIPYALFLYLEKDSLKAEKEERFQKACLLLDGSLKIDQSLLYQKYSAVNRILEQRNFLCYRQSDKDTKRTIRQKVYDFSKSHGVHEADAAAAINEQYLDEKEGQKKKLFVVLLILTPVIFTLIALVYCGLLPTILLLLPIFVLSLEIVFSIASLSVHPDPILKLDIQEIEHPTLTVITLLLTSEKELEDQAKRLEIMYHQNPDKAIRFGILADFKDGKKTEEPGDELLEKKAVLIIEELNKKYPSRFCLFIRERTPYPADGIFMGWERKRGALIELVRLIKGKKAGFKRIIAEKDFLSSCRYILTLDADTDLRMDAVKTFYAAMRHPQNRPIIKNGVVIKGYGVLQPRMATSIPSAGRSAFALLHTGSGGLDSYQTALFDFYQSVFKKGAFCGKGMFDVDTFYRVIDGAFPEGRILSHDLLEGTRLRCGYLSEFALTDSTPSTALSYFTRQHRWIRGDLQAFPFALKNLPFENTKKKNPIDALSKFMLVSNVLRALVPVFSLTALFFSTHLKESTCTVFLLFSFSYLLFPLMMSLLHSARHANRRFFSTVLQGIWQCVLETLFSFCALAYSAQVAFDALLRVLYRSLISKKRLLEWVTAGEGEKKYKNASPFLLFLLYLKKAFPSVLVGVLMMFFSVGGIVRLLGASFALYPFVAFWLSRPYLKKEKLKDTKQKKLRSYASESFLFYERFVSEKDHFLPPDNYQELPVSRLAHRTSPTNIALYLSSCLAMADLNLRDQAEMLSRIERTLDTLLLLPKYKGHLYNWYDTEKLELLGTPYISTVDSGNLAVALLSLKIGLSEKEDRAQLCEKIDRLLSPMDFSFLYKEPEGLLCIGYDPVEETQSENCYDLLLSEARSAYFYAIAKRQIPKESWWRLSTPITAKEGHIGVFSWSGTAFEYFMPPLFLPLHENTLLYEALCFALYEQEKDQTEGLWGRSESCYFAFDGMMNYQYKAFGCSSLALDPGVGAHCVIAPYASFLALCLDPSLALRNLKHLEEAGGYGNCGFYEAIDFTPDRVGRGNAVIRSYMAHHVGMSIIAIANACQNHIFVKRTMEDPHMKAAEELLCGRIPVDAPIVKNPIRQQTARHSPTLFLPTVSKERHTFENMLYASGSFRILASATQKKVSFSFEDTALTPPIDSMGPFPSFSIEGTDFFMDLLLSPMLLSGQKILLKGQKEKTEGTLLLTALPEGGLRFHFEIAPSEKNLFLNCTFPLVLAEEQAFKTHPAYSGLSVESFADALSETLIFKKRSSKTNIRPLYLAFGATIPFESTPLKEMAPSSIKTIAKKGTLPCRKPTATIRFPLSSNAPKSFDLFLVAARSKKEAIGQFLLLRKSYSTGEKVLFKEKIKRNKKRLPDKRILNYVSLLLEGVFKHRNSKTDLPCYDIRKLWQFAISGDHPIFTFLLPSDTLSLSQRKVVSALLEAHAFLAAGGVHLDLVFLRKEREPYFAPSKKELLQLVKTSSGNAFLDKKGGVHLLLNDEAQRILPSFSTVFLFVEEDCVFPSFKKAFLSCLEPNTARTQALPKKSSPSLISSKSEILSLPCGSFQSNGFISQKARQPYAPFSYIYSNRQFGTLVTDRSLGFTWFRNAAELRLTPFSGNEDTDLTGERLFLNIAGKSFDLAALSKNVSFEKGCAKYEGSVDVVDYTVFAGVDCHLPVKIMVVKLQNRSPAPLRIALDFKLTPCLFKYHDGMICEKRVGDTTFYKRSVDRTETDFGMYLSFDNRPVMLSSEKVHYALILLGSVNLKNDRCFYYVKSRFRNEQDAFWAFERYEKEERNFSSPFTLENVPPAFSLFLSNYLPLQIRKVRLFARTGFYQPGGAFGFRDQLQDALSLLYHDPKILERQLYRCAAHQYYNGDVQHWWHPLSYREKTTDWGIRGQCSDDLLWLPFALSFYLEHTQHTEILEKQISYLTSSPLAEDEERYELPQKTVRKESLYSHALRALDLTAARRSKRGLCAMGSCDWNDGFSEIKGESVWLTQFYLLCLKRLFPYFTPNDRLRFESIMAELQTALHHCFNEDRYLRAFFKSGEPLGSKDSSYCKIDLLPQSFAVFLDREDPKARKAINRAFDLLFDKENLIFKLFSPSYDSTGPFPGYLGGYCPGFRENGGQYTHAAAWGALALLLAGEHQKGFEVLTALHPITHWQKALPVYALEPYCMAGDVYSAKGFEGRGGWSQYTGSAGWYLIALLYGLLGYHEEKEFFSLSPRLCEEFSSFSLTVNKKGTIYHLQVSLGKENLILLDGKSHDNRFLFDKQEHNVKMVLQKKKK